MSSVPPSFSPFGHEVLPAAEKTARVNGLFSRVAQRYDLMNDVMSLGLQRYWKRVFIQGLPPLTPGMACVDVATGSGDIALGLVKRCPTLSLSAVDPNAAMLAQGRRKLINQGHVGIAFHQAPAEALPLASASQDLYTMAFGLRNVTDRAAALAEAYRVLKPGGWWYCLEFSHPVLPGFDGLYRAYNRYVLPTLGHCIAQDRAAYAYLAESIATFPRPSILVEEMAQVGLVANTFTLLTQGVVAVHRGQKAP